MQHHIVAGHYYHYNGFVVQALHDKADNADTFEALVIKVNNNYNSVAKVGEVYNFIAEYYKPYDYKEDIWLTLEEKLHAI